MHHAGKKKTLINMNAGGCVTKNYELCDELLSLVCDMGWLLIFHIQ